MPTVKDVPGPLGIRVRRRWKALLRGGFRNHENDLRYDLNQLQVFQMALRRHGRSFRQFRSILEFGCGYGRLTRHLFDLAPEAAIFGCDVSTRDITWCRAKYPRGRFLKNDPHPPLDLPDQQCDLILSYSVFTHLSEENHKGWLKDLSRILKPGGLMLHTVHSGLCLDLISSFSPERLANYRLGGSVEQFLSSELPYHYVPYSMDQPEYGLTIIRPEYIRRVWPQVSGLQVIDYVGGAIAAFPEGCQDLVVLRREGTA